MSTLNNQVLVRIPYIQNQLTYNIPLIVYTLNQINDLITTTDIRIQAYKTTTIETDILPVKIGNELIKNQDFLVSINNTSNGILITLNQNIPDATELRIRRESIRESATNYQGQDSLSLKQNLNKDFANYGGSIQDNYNLIHDIENQTNKYTNSIVRNYNKTQELQEQLDTHTHRATQIIFDPIPTNQATSVQEAIENQSLSILEIQKGLTLRASVRVVSDVNIDISTTNTIDSIPLNINDRVLLKNQTNKAQNGVYAFNGTGLERTLDLNTIIAIQGSRVQVNEGTFADKIFYFVAFDLQGVIEFEPIEVKELFSPLTNNQVKINNLAKQPAGTIIGNITNDIETPTYINKNDLREFLEIDNVDNTADLDKPISTATQTALDLKTNQTDFEDLNAYVVQADNNLLTAIGQKENILPRGGEQDYLGFEGNEIAVKTFSKAIVDLENVDNTSDLDKPISITQQEEFNKYLKERGILPINNLNLTFDLLTGIYFVDNINQRLNLPNEIQTTSTITLILSKVYLGEQYQKQIQQIYETKNNNTICYYIRSGNVLNNTFTDWERMSTKKELDATNVRIDNIILGEFGGDVYLIPQVDNLLNAKENTIVAGTTSQYYRGDKQMAELITDAVPEGSNPDRFYFSQPRVRATTLNGYQVNSTAGTTATDTILQALGKKADLNYTNTQFDLKANLNSPNFTGGSINLTNNLNNGLTSIINFTNPATPNNTIVILRFTPNSNNPNVYQEILSALFVNEVFQSTNLPNANLTGTPTAPTQATSDNSTKIATTEIVNAKLNEMMVGEVKAYARQNFNDFTTNGGTGTWLYCNGRTLSTATYPLLFQRIGYFYGGSGTSFNIPDLRERVVAGASSNEPINKKEGLKQEIILTKYLEPHDHGMFNNNLTELRYGIKNVSLGIYQTFGNANFTNYNTVSKTETIGGNEPYSKMQPTIYLPYFIYAI